MAAYSHSPKRRPEVSMQVERRGKALKMTTGLGFGKYVKWEPNVSPGP